MVRGSTHEQRSGTTDAPGAGMELLILGIVNTTPDSFSDGGRFLDPESGVKHAHELVANGADAIDLGAASSHPDAGPVPPANEISRLAPVLDALVAEGIAVSVDSCSPEVQRFALARGARYLNDIRGFPEPELYPVLARASAQLIVMHSIQRGPATRSAGDAATLLDDIDAFFAARIAALESAGVARERLILDPGMGFFLGSGAEPSLRVLRALPDLRTRFGLPVLVSVSRKSFLGALTGAAVGARGAATLAAELFAVQRGADYIRTHDVRALRDGLAVLHALGSSGGSGGSGQGGDAA